MEPSHFGELDHDTQFRRLNRTRFGCVLTQGQMRARLQIIHAVRLQNATQRSLVEHDNMVQALAPDGAHERLDLRILPGGSGGRQDFTNSHPADSLTE